METLKTINVFLGTDHTELETAAAALLHRVQGAPPAAEVAGLERWAADPRGTLRAFPIGPSGLRTAAHRAVGICVHGHCGVPLRLTLTGEPSLAGRLASPVVAEGRVLPERIQGAVGVLLTRLERRQQLYGGVERTTWSEGLIDYVHAVAAASGRLQAVAA